MNDLLTGTAAAAPGPAFPCGLDIPPPPATHAEALRQLARATRQLAHVERDAAHRARHVLDSVTWSGVGDQRARELVAALVHHMLVLALELDGQAHHLDAAADEVERAAHQHHRWMRALAEIGVVVVITAGVAVATGGVGAIVAGSEAAALAGEAVAGAEAASAAAGSVLRVLASQLAASAARLGTRQGLQRFALTHLATGAAGAGVEVATKTWTHQRVEVGDVALSAVIGSFGSTAAHHVYGALAQVGLVGERRVVQLAVDGLAGTAGGLLQQRLQGAPVDLRGAALGGGLGTGAGQLTDRFARLGDELTQVVWGRVRASQRFTRH